MGIRYLLYYIIVRSERYNIFEWVVVLPKNRRQTKVMGKNLDVLFSLAFIADDIDPTPRPALYID